MNLNEQKVHTALVGGGHTPYMEVSHGHRMGETESGFVVLTSEDNKILVRIRPGDDWVDLIVKDGPLHENSEYRYIVRLLVSFSRTLRACGYEVGKRNTRTLVVQGLQ